MAVGSAVTDTVGVSVDVSVSFILLRRVVDDVFVFLQLLSGVFRQSSGLEDAVAGSSRLLVEVADDDVRKEGGIAGLSHVR